MTRAAWWALYTVLLLAQFLVGKALGKIEAKLWPPKPPAPGGDA